MGKITTAVFEPGSTTANVYGLWQYDYGQVLRIQGLHLPSVVEIHFSLQETGGTSVSRIGVTKDGVTDVVIPDSMLENDSAIDIYYMFAFIYLTDDTSGQTEYKIKLQIKSRPKPEVPGGGENPNIFHEAVQAVQKSADQAAESEKQAEGWAHGREDLPERAQDNAKYYAGQTAADAKKTGTDRKEVERLVESVSGIDQQVATVENLTKQAQTSATNAALSEQAAKTAETNAQTAQAGAETAEGNAELAEQGAKASEQTVEKAKQLVTQMGQEVLNNKKHVDQTVQEFTLTAQQALADVNKVGQTQTERVQSAGNTAVESVKTAQGTATQAVETAKIEAIKAVQTEGTTQTGNVSAEGEKQTQAVQAAAQEIITDREQIQQNKAGIEALKQGKADAIVEIASGEIIQTEDSSSSGFEGLRIFGKSTQDGVPSPESPVPIVNVGDKGTVEVEVTGTNLFDVSKIEDTWNGSYGIKNNNGVLEMVSSSNDSTINSNKTLKELCPQVKVGETYVFSAINSGTRKAIYLYNTGVVEYGKPIVATNEVLNSKLKFYLSNKTNDSGIIHNIQVNKGDTVLPYEPYRTPQSIILSTPNGLPGIKVDSGGNYTDKNGQQWICDEVDLARGKYVQRIWKCTITENLSWELYAIPGSEGFWTRILPEETTNKKMLCSHFERYNDGNGKLKEGIMVGAGNDIIYFPKNRFYDASLEDKGVANWKVFLAENQVELITYLDTPVEHDLTPEEIAAYKSLHTNYPTTVVSNDESAHMEVSYVADTKNYIASKIETPLQKQITDLQNALISQKISGGGIKVTDSVRVPVIKLSMWGKTEQVKTSGKNLFDGSKIEIGGLTGNDGTPYDTNDRMRIENIKIEQGKTYSIGFDKSKYDIANTHVLDAEGNRLSDWIIKSPLPDKAASMSLSFKKPDNSECFESDVKYLASSVMFNEGASALPYEPYSGGFPSPSPDWEQPIEVTDQPITVTVKGGTEQQSVTLVPPRPLTKWDKLEKVDGVWRWVYKSGTATLKGDVEEYWKKGTTNNPEKHRFYPMMLKDKIVKCANDKIADIYCTSYIAVSANDTYTVSKNGVSIQSDGALLIYDEKYATGSIVDFTIALSKNPITVYYEAIDTECIPLPQPVQDKLNALTMYTGTTEIVNDGGCTMELTYTVDTKSYVDTKIAEVSKAII